MPTAPSTPRGRSPADARPWFGAALVAAAAGCSALYELAPDQCTTDADCTGRLAGRRCSDGMCVEPGAPDEPPGDGGAAGGDGEPGGASSGGAAGGGASSGGATTGGAGGGGPSCVTNADCMDQHWNEPYLCRDGGCIGLKTSECPRVLLPDNLKVPSPILVGAYGNTAVAGDAQILSYELALTELSRKIGGLSGGPGGSLRTFVGVVCNSVFASTTPGNADHLRPSLDHLVNTLKVPAILAALSKSDLKLATSLLEDEHQQDAPFLLNPLSSDSEVERVDTQGMLWHMLGSALDLAPAFVALTEATEAKLALEEPLRLALVYSDIATFTDIAEYVEGNLTLNGAGTAANRANGNFLPLLIPYELSGPDADYSSAVAALQELQPHVVVALTGGEFVTRLLQPLESLGATRPRFYVLGHYLSYRTELLRAANDYPGLQQRMAGVNFAGAEDRTALDGYLSRFGAEYLGASDPTSQENFYDAAYFLMYSIAAAGNVTPLTGSDAVRGMRRLVDPSSPFQYEVGPGDISEVLATLAVTSGTRLGITGTLGPPDWDISTGARAARASVWCVADDAGFDFAYDQMRYDATTGGFPAEQGLEACGITGF